MVIDFDIRADLNTLSNGDPLHAVDADTISQSRVASKLQHAAAKSQQFRPSVGTDVLSKANSAFLSNDNFRIGRKTLDSLKREVVEMEKFEDSEFQCAEAYADQIV